MRIKRLWKAWQFIHLQMIGLGLALLFGCVVAALASRAPAVMGDPPWTPLVPLPTVTPTLTPTPGWEAGISFATPALAKLPGIPAVLQLGAGVGVKVGDPVPFRVLSCPRPEVKLAVVSISPRPGWWDIAGDAKIPYLGYWKIELSPDGQAWTMLAHGNRPPVIMEFYTQSVAPGVYQMRLVAVDQTGNYPEPCVIQVTVDKGRGAS